MYSDSTQSVKAFKNLTITYCVYIFHPPFTKDKHSLECGY